MEQVKVIYGYRNISIKRFSNNIRVDHVSNFTRFLFLCVIASE